MTAYAKNIFILSCVVIFITVGSFNANAEFYKWVDEKGVVYFSDTPPANKKKVEIIPEIPIEKIGGTEQIPVPSTEASEKEATHESQIRSNEQESKKDQEQLVATTDKKEKTDKKTRKTNTQGVGTKSAQTKNKVDLKPYKKACTRCR